MTCLCLLTLETSENKRFFGANEKHLYVGFTDVDFVLMRKKEWDEIDKWSPLQSDFDQMHISNSAKNAFTYRLWSKSN